MKAKLLVNLSGLSTFLMRRLKCSHAERRGEGLKSISDKMESEWFSNIEVSRFWKEEKH